MKNPQKSIIFMLKSNRTPNLTLNLNRSKNKIKICFNGTSPSKILLLILTNKKQLINNRKP